MSTLVQQALDVQREPIEIHGVQFFDSASSCISYFENIAWTIKAVSLIQSFGTFFLHSVSKVTRTLSGAGGEVDAYIDTASNPLSNKKLIVCIHGLNAKPSQYKGVIEEIKKRGYPETDIFIPPVLNKGNTKLDDAVAPIFEEIAKWASISDEKELILIGISNGARIARALEVKVACSESCANIKQLRFISVAGACQGSYAADLVKSIGLTWLMSKDISEEMPTDSAHTRHLNEEWAKALSKGPEREYTFIAALHDCLVPNYSSTLMETGDQKALYAIVPNHGHFSLVKAISSLVAEIALNGWK